MFSIKESIKYGWEKTKENMELIFLITLFILIIESLTGSFNGQEKNLYIQIIGLVSTILMVILKIGYNKILLKIYDGEKTKFGEIFDEYKTFWRYLGVSLLYPLTILAGLFLLIVPGVIWAVRFSFSPIIVVDTKLGPITAMKESYAISKGSYWQLFLFWLVIAIINFVGLIFFGIGLLLTIPISTIAYIKIYRELSQKKAALLQTVSPQTT